MIQNCLIGSGARPVFFNNFGILFLCLIDAAALLNSYNTCGLESDHEMLLQTSRRPSSGISARSGPTPRSPLQNLRLPHDPQGPALDLATG